MELFKMIEHLKKVHSYLVSEKITDLLCKEIYNECWWSLENENFVMSELEELLEKTKEGKIKKRIQLLYKNLEELFHEKQQEYLSTFED